MPNILVGQLTILKTEVYGYIAVILFFAFRETAVLLELIVMVLSRQLGNHEGIWIVAVK